MRIRRCASRLLGHDYPRPAPPPFELPPTPPFELPLPPPPQPPPPPVLQRCTPSSSAHTGALSAEPPCGHSQSPWDLMALLDPSDPQKLELFKETYFVSVAFRTSWFFPAARIKEEEQEDQEEEDIAVDMVDMVDEVNDKPWHEVLKKKAVEKTVMDNKEGEKNASSPNKRKRKRKRKERVIEEDDDYVADGGGKLWMCKKNDGKTWFCRRSVSQPDSYCSYHSDPKREPQPVLSAASKPSKRRRKRALDVDEGFYYYAGFGPSRSKRHCKSSSSVMESPPAEQKEEAPPEEHADLNTVQHQADDADHQVASAHVDERMCDDTVGIAGYDEESSDDTFGWNSEPRVVDVNGGIKRKSPFKKRWRKPVKARSLKSLM